MAPVQFDSLQRVVAKYKRDVNTLGSPAEPEAITALEGHLGHSLPPTLRTFLSQHDGADLLRGTVRVRKTSQVSVASAERPEVVLFAETAGPTHWGFAQDGQGGWAFGLWDGATLDPYHSTFAGWLAGTIAITETRTTRDDDRDNLRFEADRDDVYQLVQAGERALHRGDPDEAEQHLRVATRHHAGRVAGFARLGDALAVTDRSAARQAWLQAFKNAQLPLPWPGAPCLDPDVVRQLAAAFSKPEDYERLLTRFLDEQVGDVFTDQEADVVVAAARAAARSAVDRGQRRMARDVLANLLGRCRTFTWQGVPFTAVLELARLEAELGHHDEAEALLRRLRHDGPDDMQGPAALLLGAIAVTRQEPWAEDILRAASDAGLSDSQLVECAALRVERAVRLNRIDEAKAWLAKAQAATRRVATRPLLALLCLAEGDVHRSEEAYGQARDSYAQGLAHLDEKDEPQLRFRLMLRLGDLAGASRRYDKALRRYQDAAEGFAHHELPVREAWALMRLARYAERPEPLIRAARERFEAADLAAGMAALDSMLGDSGASLEWHLNRSTAQARARHDAQRSRPPWSRADAERPERRLGAHRLAIAACDESVVTALAREMDSCARAMSTGRVRPLDPPVLRYVAAVDLLSGHRSFSAAQVLLDHLVRQPTQGPARQALQGAVARSPNAALVDGLLRCIERPSEHPAKVVAEATEALGLRRELHAKSALLALAAPGANPTSRKAALTALGRLGDRSVAEALIPALDDPNLEELAALALLMLGDRRGVAFHAEALTQNRKNLSGSPGEIVGRYGSPSHLLLLRNAAVGSDDKALGALQGLGLLGDPRAVPVLLDALEHRDLHVTEVAAGALQILTGHHEEVGQPGWKSRWNLWWEKHAPELPEGRRHRDGQLFALGSLLDKMDHSDAWVRRTSYDELVITSGHSLPFDADGPWRTQRNHLKAWRAWWVEAREHFVAGNWYLDGQVVG